MRAACHRRAALPPSGDAAPSKDSIRLLLAARAYAAQLEELDEDEDAELGDEELESLAATTALGLEAGAALSDVQRRYAPKLADALAEKVAALASRERAGSATLAEGQRLYERGRYSEAAEVLEAAEQEAGRETSLGGEACLWLALAYDSSGRREECIALYKALEEKHPAASVRKQAASLRYILEAPKLPISAEERVSIPLVQDAASVRDKWARSGAARKRVEPSALDKWMEEFQPPGAMQNRFVWAATSVISFGLAIYSAMHVRHH